MIIVIPVCFDTMLECDKWTDGLTAVTIPAFAQLATAATEAVKKWDGGRSPSGEVWEGLPSFGGLGCYPLKFFFENKGANLCNLLHFWDIR